MEPVWASEYLKDEQSVKQDRLFTDYKDSMIFSNSLYSGNYYYRVLPLNEKIEKNKVIIESFISKMIKNSHDIDADFSGAVDDHFWELV
jgi:hypothetical protein